MAPPPPPPTSTQYTQFLNNVLSQRGPSSLAYTEDAKWLIRQHLLSLIETYPSLSPKTATFTHNDGTTVNLLQADGTIPMTYQSITYNIPIILWLIESYPRHPPCVYVAPTRDMIIKRPHSNVNPSGLVSATYLHNWVYPSSNLADLVRNISLLFGRDPPLYTRQQPRPAPPPGVVNDNVGNAGNSRPYGAKMSQKDDPNEVYRKNVINKLLESLVGDVATLRKIKEGEMEGMFSAQAVLRQREEMLSEGLREMNEEKEGLEQQLQMVLMNLDLLEVWLRENEGLTAKRNGDADVYKGFEPCDAFSKQMLECTASDLAIEDLVYSLDKDVQGGGIPFDQYIKNIRMLSREQFFHRATSAKVRAAQMQAQIASMAARAPQYAL